VGAAVEGEGGEMSSRILEHQLISVYCELQRQGMHCEAALLDMGIFRAKGYLPKLMELRDQWKHMIKEEP
jgi:hypothetical protein